MSLHVPQPCMRATQESVRATNQHTCIYIPCFSGLANCPRKSQGSAHDVGLSQGPVVIAHRTPLVVVEDLHSSLVHVGPTHQPHGVLVRGNGGTNDAGVVVMVARGGVPPARVRTVKDTFFRTITVQIIQPNLKTDGQFNTHP